MTYIVTVLIIAAIPLLLGVRLGQPFDRWYHSHRTAGAVAVIVCALAWLGAAYWARDYADGDGAGWSAAEWFSHAGKWYIFATVVLCMLGIATHTGEIGRARKISLVISELVVVLMLVWRTVPAYTWLPKSTSRDDRGHIRQSIEYTCGPVSLGNLLEQVTGHPSPSERDLARLSGTTVEGTRMKGLIRAAETLGLELVACRVMDYDELKTLRMPAIVQISTLPTVRHATLLLEIKDDSITFIDPAYGYREITAERFRKTWYGKTAVFKSSQVIVRPENAGQASRLPDSG